MNIFKLTSLILLCLLAACSSSQKRSEISSERLYDFALEDINGETMQLSAYKGQVILLMNTSLKCGTTPQFKEAQKIYEEYKEKGFIVIAFPSDDFTKELEPRNSQVIQDLSSQKYGVTFPLCSIGSVTGEQAQPLFKYIKNASPEDMKGDIDFNFEKFLIDRH